MLLKVGPVGWLLEGYRATGLETIKNNNNKFVRTLETTLKQAKHNLSEAVDKTYVAMLNLMHRYDPM